MTLNSRITCTNVFNTVVVVVNNVFVLAAAVKANSKVLLVVFCRFVS